MGEDGDWDLKKPGPMIQQYKSKLTIPLDQIGFSRRTELKMWMYVSMSENVCVCVMFMMYVVYINVYDMYLYDIYFKVLALLVKHVFEDT